MDRSEQHARRPRSAQQQSAVRSGGNGTQPEMLLGRPKSARCVQRFDDSLNPAIRTTYRISLRSSSLREPRHSLLGVVFVSLVRVGRRPFGRGPTRAPGRKDPPQSRARARPRGGTRVCGKRRDGRTASRKRRHGEQRWVFGCSVMILPQVHLRKPCYDFSFL